MRAFIMDVCGLQDKTLPIEMLIDNEETCKAMRESYLLLNKRLNIEMTQARECHMEEEIAMNWISR